MGLTRAWKITIVGATLLMAVGCQRLMNQDAAVQKAIQDHLAERSDLAMDKMVMEVQQVQVDGDKAQAEVVFRVTSDPNSRMAYHYDLSREGGTWKVDSGRPGGAESSHPQAGEPMAGEPESPAPSELPEGHPPITGANPPGEEPPASAYP